jgi:hypothetical protein
VALVCYCHGQIFITNHCPTFESEIEGAVVVVALDHPVVNQDRDHRHRPNPFLVGQCGPAFAGFLQPFEQIFVRTLFGEMLDGLADLVAVCFNASGDPSKLKPRPSG